MKKKDKNLVWILDIDTAISIMELAKKNGKKPGDSMQEEFIEVMNWNRDKFKLMGYTDKDIDLLTGEMRENGLRILNLKENNRRDKRNGKSKDKRNT